MGVVATVWDYRGKEVAHSRKSRGHSKERGRDSSKNKLKPDRHDSQSQANSRCVYEGCGGQHIYLKLLACVSLCIHLGEV